jgi:hypothetical protein
MRTVSQKKNNHGRKNYAEMNIEILKAGREDLEIILKLQKECYITEAEIYNDFLIPPLRQDLESIGNEYAGSVILKCVCNGELIGSVRGYSKGSTLYIGKLIVGQKFRNRGLGLKLMEAIENEFPDCNRFELFTGHKSTKNLYLYNRLGYREFRQELVNDKLTMIFLEKIR